MLPLIILAIENEEDRDFMAAVYINYQRLMFLEIKKRINEQDTAEDLIQDVLVKLISKVQLLRTFDTKRLTCYVAVSAKNAARNHIRKMKSTREVFIEDVETWRDDGDEGVEDFVMGIVMLEELFSSWHKLSETSQEVLERKYILMQSDDEIAEAFGIKRASVRMKLTRARQEAHDLILAEQEEAEKKE